MCLPLKASSVTRIGPTWEESTGLIAGRIWAVDLAAKYRSVDASGYVFCSSWAIPAGARCALRRLHATLTVVWLALCVPALLWWKNSVPFLVFISMYAIVVSHWDAYQTAKVGEQ